MHRPTPMTSKADRKRRYSFENSHAHKMSKFDWWGPGLRPCDRVKSEITNLTSILIVCPRRRLLPNPPNRFPIEVARD
jgi:hypothetical protein